MYTHSENLTTLFYEFTQAIHTSAASFVNR
jgi:hypothetical protein